MKGKVGNKMKSRGKKDNQRTGERKEGEGSKENRKIDEEKLEKKKEKSEGNQMKFLKFCSRPITVT